MDLEQFTHALRAAKEITGESEFVIIGSQSVLGIFSYEDLPERAVLSQELDVYAKNDPDGSITAQLNLIGVGSTFDASFDFYLDPVGPRTAKAPPGWEDRLVPFTHPDAPGVIAHCLHPTDLCVAKLVAGRGKDKEFVDAVSDAGLVDLEDVLFWIETIEPDDEHQAFNIDAARSWSRWKLVQMEGQQNAAIASLRRLNVEDLVSSVGRERARCPHWRPRAQRYCYLRAGHLGKHD